MKNGLIIDDVGTKRWYKDNQLHSKVGPAVEVIGGTKWWFQHGSVHRLDGPAIEYADGVKSWYINNQYVRVNSQKEFEKSVEYREWKLKVFW